MRPIRERWRDGVAGLVMALWLVGTSLAAAAGDASEPVKFGVLAFRPKPETIAQWQPVVDYLNAANIGRRFVLVPLTYPEMDAAVKGREVGVILTQPANYIQLAKSEGLHSPIATMVGKEAGHQLDSFGGVIVAEAGRTDIRNLEDLRGKRIAASDTESLGGFLMQAMELLRKGIRLPGDAQVIVTGVPHDKAIYEMLAGRADAAFVRTGVVEAMQREGKLDAKRIRVVNPQTSGGYPFVRSTPLYPQWALSTMPWLGDETTLKIAIAVLSMPHGGEVASAAKIHGFTIPGNYQPVEELMRELRVKPFDAVPPFTLMDIWQRYQVWVSLLLLAVLVALVFFVMSLRRANRSLEIEKGQVSALYKRLQETEARYRALVTSSPDWIWEVDSQGVYTFSSPRVHGLLGYTPEEIVGRAYFDLMPPGEGARIKALFGEVCDNKRELAGIENINLHKDGHEVVLETSAVPILDEQGGLLGYRGVDRDITARKQTQMELDAYRNHLEEQVAKRNAELVAAETRYRTVAEFTYDWESWIGADGVWQYCSPSCRRVTGHDAHEFMANPDLFLNIVHPEDRASVAVHLSDVHHQSEDVSLMTFRIVRPDGEAVWLEHVCQPVYGKDQQFLGRRATNRDITARRTAEIELIDARDAAMVANAAKNAFLANMSHEMRTPLHQISGMAQLVRREPLSPRQLERMDKLDIALRNMTLLVEKILELSKIESGRIVVGQGPVDVRKLLDNVAGQIHDQAAAKNLRVIIEAEGAPDGLLGDAMHIQAALGYLAENAVKFTEAGSVAIGVRLDEDRDAEALLRFEVEDTGIGIAPEVLPRLFNVFELADNSMTRRYNGAGIGLAMVRRLARLMGGEAGCSSEPGSGSTFWFTVRLKKVA